MAYRDEVVIDDRSRGIFRVHRSAMTAEQIFADERSRIFNRCWLYVGHASEVARPGDYLRRWVGGQPVIFLRDSAGTVRIHYNTCTHRGATLCREESGNTRVFQCFYHAWTFDTAGKLIVTPGTDAYAAGFDKADYALRSPAQVAEYRGLYFINHDPDAVDLLTYLAGATEYLDLILDQGDEGMRIVDGAHRYSAKANWKLMVENSIDGYHAPTVHATYLDFVKDSGGGQNPAALGTGGGLDLGNGHAVIESVAAWAKPTYWEPFFGDEARPEIEAKRARLIDRHGAERGERIAGNFRNLLIFPNLIINDVAAITVRRVEPVAPDRVSVEAWALAPVEEADGSPALQRRLDNFLTFLGPGGFASPDDVEALESCQQGFAAQPAVEWSDISRGMARVPLPNDELQIRTFWRMWASQLDDAGFPEQVVDVEAPQVSQPGGPVMTAVIAAQVTGLRSRVEDFLYAEAALLDEWRLDDWLGLLTAAARYEVPSTDRPGGHPDTTLMLVSDTRSMISARVKRLNSRKAYREFLWSRTRRIVGNVRVLAVTESGELEVTANFAVYRTRNGQTHCYAGRYLYRLVPDGEGFLIAFRRAELDQETLDEHGTLSIIL